MTEQTFAGHLKRAIQGGSSGTIQVRTTKGELHGEVLLSEGRIAWAACRGQTDTLGVCLWRLGRLSREQLDLLRKAYEASRGTRKLAELFEELGLMSGPVLRRCLLLHIRSAVTRLLADGGTATMVESRPRTDDNHLFSAEEVLPPSFWPEGADSVQQTQAHRFALPTLENSVIEDLAALPGHLASAVIAADGEVLTGYVSCGAIKLGVLGAFLAGAVEASSRLMTGTPLKDIEELMVDCSGGWAAIRWVDPQHKYLCVVLLDRSGNPSIARYALKRAIPQVLTWLERGGLVERAGEQAAVSALEVPSNPFDSQRRDPGARRLERPQPRAVAAGLPEASPFDRPNDSERYRLQAPPPAALDPFSVTGSRRGVEHSTNARPLSAVAVRGG